MWNHLSWGHMAVASTTAVSAVKDVNIFDIGVVGLSVVALILLLDITRKLVDKYITGTSAKALPENVNGTIGYNEQFARVVYDSSRTLSEVAEANRTTAELVRADIKLSEELLEVMKAHSQETHDWMIRYERQSGKP